MVLRSTLTVKQKAQRTYASAMRGIRAGAKGVTRGRGRISARKAATTLRKTLGLKAGGRRVRKVARKVGIKN